MTVGILDAQRIGAKTLTVDKLLVTSTDNLIQEPDFSGSGVSWELPTNFAIVPTGGRNSLPAMQITNTASLQTSFSAVGVPTKTPIEYPTDAGNSYRIVGWVYSSVTVPASGAYITARFKSTTGSYTSYNVVYTDGSGTPITIPSGTWTQISGIVTAPASTLSVAFSINSAASLSTGTIKWDFVSATRASGGTLIIDGALDGKLITGSTIQTAASGARVVMDSTGLKAYDSSSVEYLTADSTGLTLTGLLISRGMTDEFTPRPMAARIGKAVNVSGGVGTSVNFPSIWFDLDDSHSYSHWEPPSVSSHTGSGIEMKSGRDSTYKYASVTLGTGDGGGAIIYAVSQLDMYPGVDGVMNFGGVDTANILMQAKDVSIQSLYGTTGLALSSTSNMTLDATTSVKINGRQVGMANYLEYVQTQNSVPDTTVSGPGQPSSYSRSTDTGIAHWSANDTLYFDKKGIYTITFTINIDVAVTGRTFSEFSMSYDAIQIARNTVFAGEDTVTTSATVRVNVGETVVFKYYQTSGGSRTVQSRIKIARISDI